MQGNEDINKVYTLEKTLGEGAFGVVKRAVKKSTGEQFAVKIINKENLSNDDLLALQTEVEILTQIDHPNVVKLYEIYEDDTYFYMVLELMTGGELFERIVEKDHFSEKEAAATLRPIIDALTYCHKMGIVHRDLKPENLLYSSMEPGALLKVSDFGLARFVGSEEVMMTQCGTPGYVAPEIINGKGYTEAIDFWSVGVILYIMLCGFPPFYDEDNDKLFSMIKNGNFNFPSPYWDQISNEAKELIKGLLTIDPAKRLTTEKILKHPWLLNNTHKSIVNLQAKLKDYRASKKIKRIANVLTIARGWGKMAQVKKN
ncbi:unnamed protein product [Paramecium primaurelia]|uniref:Protein kinase domain-containing protein n=2 Tax=Paramecium TaxID=5884 RepID=A0A8S1WCR4_9CILI|nr:unnamed protein product [Paramecium primaurelia]CAD8186587.1 unnamed protein product [Paramecium pentaurelia]